MTRSKETTTFTYKGFSSLNGTIVPDDVFDVLAPELNEAELRVLLYIVRRTFGFKKDSDNISLRQMVEGITTKDGRVLDRGTGMSKSAVARGLAGLREKKIIVAARNSSAERGNEATTYRLRFEHDRDDERNDPMVSIGVEASTPLSRQRDKGVSQQRDKGLSRQRDTQETVEQQTVKQETDRSNIRKAPTSKVREGTMTKPPETIRHGRPPMPRLQSQERDAALP
ncbi:MAG TPA: replication protein, partial [Herpetosiphonaceae bacterium]|nr:replication protein [Herpetosiphonaceae bacterium]